MSEETEKPGAALPRTGAQELLVLAQRLDGFMEWLGGPNHTGWHHIQDMPDKLRDLARRQILAKDAGVNTALYLGNGDCR